MRRHYRPLRPSNACSSSPITQDVLMEGRIAGWAENRDWAVRHATTALVPRDYMAKHLAGLWILDEETRTRQLPPYFGGTYSILS